MYDNEPRIHAAKIELRLKTSKKSLVDKALQGTAKKNNNLAYVQ